MNFMNLFSSRNWTNWGGNIKVEPSALKDTAELTNNSMIEMVRKEMEKNGLIKIVGSGHSFSDILETSGTLLYRSKKSLNSTSPVVQDVDKTLLKDQNSEGLVQISGRATIDEINKALKAKGLAFNNLGSAVLQTYAGAISTSTHGTGRAIPPLSDDVRSMLLVSPALGVCRVEPADGITDRTKFEQAYPGIKLIQNDNIFCATLVSMGCMGVILDCITAVRPCYKLEETRSFITWSRLKKELTESPDTYLDGRHFDIIINPYAVKGEYSCIITRRRIVPPDTPNTRDRGKFTRKLVVLFQLSIARFFKNYPCFIAKFLDISIKSLAKKTPYIDESTEIFDIDLLNKVRAVSAEYVFPLRNNIYLGAIDAILQKVVRNSKMNIHQNSPFGIRFVAPGKAYLSMMHGEPMCTIETPLLANTKGWRPMLNSYERICMHHGGRPHWGQYHELTGQPGWLTKSYTKATEWLEVLHQFDPKGVLSNKFTKRMGFQYDQ